MAEHKKLRQSYEELQNSVASIQATIQQIGQAFGQLQKYVGQNAEVLSAVVSVLGENLVQDELLRLRKERQDAQEAAQTKNVKELVDAGVLVVAETVTPESFIVGQDAFKDGNVRRVQFEVSGLAEEDKKKYVGLKAGGKVETEQVTMTVTEVYVIDQAKAVEYAKAQQEKLAPKPPPAPPVEVQAAAASEAMGPDGQSVQ
jgi:hypothetical protein